MPAELPRPQWPKIDVFDRRPPLLDNDDKEHRQPRHEQKRQRRGK